jgi:glycosyltransferase involved in cell wall biosynthesis
VRRVAVVLPIHNAERFLAKTLQHLVDQTYDDWKAVLVDDASTDGSTAVAQKFVDEHPDRFELLALETNVGVAEARNRGVQAMPETELIALVDHDDWVLPAFLEHLVALHDRERGKGRLIGIAACDAKLYGAHGLERDTWGQRTGWRDVVDLDALIQQNYIFARALFRRDAFQAVGGFAPETNGADDRDLWLRIVEVGYEVAVTREPLAIYRIAEGAQSGDKLAIAQGDLSVCRRLLARGHLTPAQKLAVRRRVVHYQAVRARWAAEGAWTEGRRATAAGYAIAGLPLAVAAAVQDPRWVMARRRRRLPDAAPPEHGQENLLTLS